MVQILPYVPGFGEQLAQSLGDAAKNVGQGYLEGREKRQDATILKELGEGQNLTPVQMIERYGKLSQKGQAAVSPLLGHLFNSQKEEKRLASEEKRAGEKLKFDKEKSELDRANKLKVANVNADARKNAAELNANKKLSPFDEAVQKKSAEDYLSLQKSLPELEQNLQSVDEIEKLADKLRGPLGYAKILAGSQDAAELDALGLLTIAPYLKVLNPVGAIPQRKIELIREKAAPKAGDFHSVILGKTKAIRHYTNQAIQRAKNRLEQYQQYGGNIPKEVEKSLNAQDEADADAVISQVEALEKNPPKDQPETPNPGKRQVNPKTGQVRILGEDGQWKIQQ